MAGTRACTKLRCDWEGPADIRLASGAEQAEAAWSCCMPSVANSHQGTLTLIQGV